MFSISSQAMAAGRLGPLLGIIIVLALFDAAMKGWGMWRAARMSKNIWFIALLIVNSLGILPIIFLLVTKKEYAKMEKKR